MVTGLKCRGGEEKMPSELTATEKYWKAYEAGNIPDKSRYTMKEDTLSALMPLSQTSVHAEILLTPQLGEKKEWPI